MDHRGCALTVKKDLKVVRVVFSILVLKQLNHILLDLDRILSEELIRCSVLIICSGSELLRQTEECLMEERVELNEKSFDELPLGPLFLTTCALLVVQVISLDP